MKLKIEIEMDNSAFTDNEGELRDIFGRIDYAVSVGAEGGSIRDGNGNKVGFWETTEEAV